MFGLNIFCDNNKCVNDAVDKILLEQGRSEIDRLRDENAQMLAELRQKIKKLDEEDKRIIKR